jgi:hypothetical protein
MENILTIDMASLMGLERKMLKRLSDKKTRHT